MTPEKKGLYRIMLHARLSKLSGMAFQNFFSEAMKLANPNFIPVKPQGSQGDWKNDGHIPDDGSYFQVYSPEELSESEAIKKLQEDFNGLLEKWGDKSIYPNGIKSFQFVINDHYRVIPGGYPTTIAALEQLKNDHQLEACGLFLSKDLENLILSLDEEKIISIIGYPPSPSEIGVLELSLINEVVTHIVESTPTRSLIQSMNSPDFDAKIDFNQLKITATWLREANYRVGTLEDYFNANGTYARQEIRDKLKGIYEESKTINFEDLADQTNTSEDARLLHILEHITPNKPKANKRAMRELQDAALVIMAYFFESCDIYEEPTKC